MCRVVSQPPDRLLGPRVSDEEAGAPNEAWTCSITGSTIESATLTVSHKAAR